ncbi:MAG: P1 family peptidase, partial [Candidatus Heimdallarchaeota archaeon]|nr:P1 family peptidase [Candidatus Heimdallarchaeota archaeon]
MTKARKYGIPFPGKCGTHNSITDVIGVKVGHTTLIDGEGRLIVGTGPIRTGVTCILPRGDETMAIPVYGAYYSLNGNGEMTGCHWIKESGFVSGPIMITNTHSVGAVHEATIAYIVEKTGGELWSLPVVAETWDGFLNDINGFHVRREHVFSAIQSASDGDVVEGNVGGGTGMICHQFKGGIGTSSRIINIEQNEYTVGVLVQANYGYRESLTIAGIPIGEFITDRLPTKSSPDQGSIIVIVATDAPLLPHQLDRLVRRVPLGIAKVGGFGGNSSGD